MKQVVLFIFLYIPIVSSACQWKVEVKNNVTNELKYYLANTHERTEFIVTTGKNKPFAACSANVQPEKIKTEDKKTLEKVETAVLLCAYVESLGYPIATSASRFLYKDNPEKSNPIIMTLLSTPDKGQKLKSLFTIRYACR